MGFNFEPRATPPVDPWPSAPVVPGYAHDGRTRSFPSAPMFSDEPTEVLVGQTRRPIGPQPRYTGVKGSLFGYVYELILDDQPDDITEYIGKSEQTMAERMRGHRSAEDLARYPWKARIKAGAAGYRILERVRCTGEGYEADRRALLRAESDWIDRRRPIENGPRPVRPRKAERPRESRREAARRTGPAKRRTRADIARTRRLIRLVSYVALVFACTALAARVVLAMELPWAWAPWAVAPVAGGLGALWVFTGLDRTFRKVRGR